MKRIRENNEQKNREIETLQNQIKTYREKEGDFKNLQNTLYEY